MSPRLTAAGVAPTSRRLTCTSGRVGGIGRQRTIEFGVSRQREQVADAHARERPRLLRHQRVERVEHRVAAVRRDEDDRAELASRLRLVRSRRRVAEERLAA